MNAALDTAHRQASPSASLYLDALTGVRGFAALWVFLYHAWISSGPQQLFADFGGWRLDLTPFWSGGSLGVNVFFVLSGFLLTLPFARAERAATAPPAYLEFYRRRALRVLPAYYAQLSILIPLLFLGFLTGPADLLNVVLHALMAHNFYLPYAATINGPYWSMPTEWDFYLIFPLLLALSRPQRWIWLLAGTLLLVLSYRGLAYQAVASWPLGLRVLVLEQLPGRLEQFVFGMLAARYFVFLRADPEKARQLARWGDAIFVLGCALGLVLMYWLHEHFRRYLSGHWSLLTWHAAFSAAVTLAILGIAGGGRWVGKFFAHPAAVWLGLISYSVYLWHFPVLELLSAQAWLPRSETTHWWPLFFLAAPLVLAISAIWFHLFERPFLARDEADYSGFPALGRLVHFARTRTLAASACAIALLTAWGGIWTRIS